MEVSRLRVQDIDFGLKSMIVRGGKGDKDRITVLPDAIKNKLKEHLLAVKEIQGIKGTVLFIGSSNTLSNLCNNFRAARSLQARDNLHWRSDRLEDKVDSVD